MDFVLGMVAGAFISFVVLVAFMAPKHWETYHETVSLQASLDNVAEERDHYKNLVRPNEWGTVAQREAGIKPKPPRPYRADEAVEQMVKYQFDDIKDGGD